MNEGRDMNTAPTKTKALHEIQPVLINGSYRRRWAVTTRWINEQGTSRRIHTERFFSKAEAQSWMDWA